MNLLADLHTHTVHSDGTLTVKELLEKTKKAGLSGLSITDHDNIKSNVEAIEFKNSYNFEFLNGVELTVSYEGREVHLLGYGFDIDNSLLHETLNRIAFDRKDRAKSILYGLEKEYNLKIDFEYLKEKYKNSTITRSHIAKELIEKGLVEDIKTVFDYYLGDDSPAVKQKIVNPIQDAIHLIKVAKGKSVIAHPGKLIDRKTLEVFINMGLDGIEVFHPSHSVENVRYLLKKVKENNLIATGGSDFHGNRSFDDENFGNYTVNIQVLEQLIS